MKLRISIPITSLIASLVTLNVGCSSVQPAGGKGTVGMISPTTTIATAGASASGEQTPTDMSSVTTTTMPLNQMMVQTNYPKIGLILGPGAVKSYAHIGALREIVKAKLPVVGIVGIEMGALVGALYANKGQVFDPEWQMMKLKEEEILDRSLMGSSKLKDISSLNNFLKMAFADRKNEESKIPFACPALNNEKRTIFLMARGSYPVMLPFCLPLPPLFRPHNQNIAAAQELKSSVEYLKSRGAEFVIFVNVINTNMSDDNPFWGMITYSLLQQVNLVNYVIQVPLDDYKLTDFDKRKEMIQIGSQAAQKAVQDIRLRFAR